MTAADTVTVTRPSRTPGRAGSHPHVVILDAASRTPVDVEHPCSCAAGSNGRWCWAVLEIMAEHPGQQIADLARAEIARRAGGKS